MDIVSFVIGTNGLLAFAQTAFNITKTLQEAHSFPEDMTKLLSHLSFETAKVRCWSLEAAALRAYQNERPLLGPRDQDLLDLHRHMIQLCEKEIGAALVEIDKITQKYIIVPELEEDNQQATPSANAANTAVPQNTNYSFHDGAHFISAVMASPAVPTSTQGFKAKAWGIQTASYIRKISTIKKIAAVLKPWGVADKRSLEENLKRLESWNDRIYSLLPESEIIPVKARVRTLLVRDFDDRRMLEGIGRAAKNHDPEITKSATLAIQVMDARHNSWNCDCDKYNIPYSSLIMQDSDLGSSGILHETGFSSSGFRKSSTGSPVFVEWLNYSGLDNSQEQIARNRIHALCHILDTDKPNALQTLRFLGYVQNYEDKYIGILSLVEDPVQPLVSLRKILEGNRKASSSPYPRLSLGQRFSLALQMCKVFLELHTARWLHRGFSSHCVLLRATTFSVHSDAAVVCGFQYARPIGRTQISLPLSHQDLAQRSWYLHPDVRHDGQGGSESQETYTKYQAHHDIFSLGIVLLELGMGMAVEEMVQPASTRFVESLHKRARKNLPFHMGDRYTDIVEHCLGSRNNLILAPGDLTRQEHEDHGNVMELTLMLDQIVLSLEECGADKL
jgi:hypothetical protein